MQVSGQSTVSSYHYNGLGDRLSQTVNGMTTNYTLDLNAGLTQVLDDGTSAYVYGVGRIAQVQGTTTEYFLGDALGSVRQLTNPSGQVTLTKSYAPYGEVMSSNGSGSSPFAYTGEQQDVSGLTYLRARYYAPGDGRFLTRDMWGGDYNNPLSLNRWMYVNGNPINHIDPSGRFAIDIPLDMPAWMAILGTRTVYSKVGPLKFCLGRPDNGISNTDTVNDLLVDYICEYGPEHRKFSGFDHLTLQLAKTATIHVLRTKFHDGRLEHPGGTNKYEFDNLEFVLATIDAWKSGDEVSFDIAHNISVPIPITHFLGSFEYSITKYDSGTIKFVVTNQTDLESGTRIPPILGGVDLSNAKQGLSIEEIIRDNPLLFNESLSTLIEQYPVISVLDPKSRAETSFGGGGGTMQQTFTWYEKYDECTIEQYPWPVYLNYLVIDRSMY